MEHILQALRGKGYATDGAQFPISRPDRATVPLVTRTGMPVVGKLYPSGQGERIAGRPLAEFSTPDKDSLSAAVRLVASLHESQTRPGRRRDARRLVRALRQKVESTPALDPAYASSLWAVVEALEAVQVEDLEIVPCHGDFSPRNVLVGPDRVVLIDWDRFQRADPTLDLTSMG